MALSLSRASTRIWIVVDGANIASFAGTEIVTAGGVFVEPDDTVNATLAETVEAFGLS